MSVDLRQLAVRDRSGAPTFVKRRSHALTRYVLPGAIVVTFLAVLGWAARDRLLPSASVTVVSVLTSTVEIQSEGTPLFQAAGWVEPRPTPVLATALAEGVVESLSVVEGQEVKAGELVAKLIDTDARLAILAAEAELRQREADADVMLAKAEADLLFLPFELQTAEAQFKLASREHENRRSIRSQKPGLMPEIELLRVETDLTVAKAKVEQLKTRKGRLEREVNSLKQMREACHEGHDWKAIDPMTESEASMSVCLAHARQAQVALDLAKLRLERMTVRSPTSGRVLALLTQPGARLMGQSPMGHQEASTVVSLYDPTRLQVRADVRLEDVPRVQPGQAVRIETPAAPGGPIDGVVLLPTSQADIQKNTLQVKVAITHPPPTIRTDMLVTVTFLAPHSAKPDSQATPSLRMLIPKQLIESDSAGSHVWVADQTNGIARMKSVTTGKVSGDLIEVVEGLNVADKLIVSGREGLGDGQRIAITGEDASFISSGLSKTTDNRGAGKH